MKSRRRRQRRSILASCIIAMTCGTAAAQATPSYLEAPAWFPFGLGGFVNGIAVKDLNQDGREDVVMAAGALLEVMLGTQQSQLGTPTFTAYNGATLAGFSNPVLADMNRDGLDDVVVHDYLCPSGKRA